MEARFGQPGHDALHDGGEKEGDRIDGQRHEDTGNCDDEPSMTLVRE
jgi:hypothetical protein